MSADGRSCVKYLKNVSFAFISAHFLKRAIKLNAKEALT